MYKLVQKLFGSRDSYLAASFLLELFGGKSFTYSTGLINVYTSSDKIRVPVGSFISVFWPLNAGEDDFSRALQKYEFLEKIKEGSALPILSAIRELDPSDATLDILCREVLKSKSSPLHSSSLRADSIALLEETSAHEVAVVIGVINKYLPQK